MFYNFRIYILFKKNATINQRWTINNPYAILIFFSFVFFSMGCHRKHINLEIWDYKLLWDELIYNHAETAMAILYNAASTNLYI